MKPSILTDIRSAALTDEDAMAIVNCLVCQFSSSSLVGTILLDCAIELDNAIIPSEEDLPDDSWKARQDAAVEQHEERGFNARMSLARGVRL